MDWYSDRLCLLTNQAMSTADRLTIEGGIPGITLMEQAGQTIAAVVQQQWSPRPVVVLCGPGNNGGDGFIAAQTLREMGWSEIEILTLNDLETVRGDAALAAGRWAGKPPERVTPEKLIDLLQSHPVVIDALFGAGLTRPLEGLAYDLVTVMNQYHASVLAVDIPSGIDGDSGEIRGIAPYATITVTFFRKKPGHLLLPGRLHVGKVIVTDIGIPDSVLSSIQPQYFENHPDQWLSSLIWPTAMSHKYTRGHALIVGGNQTTGAARLATRGCQRLGIGMVTLACEPQVTSFYRSVMLSPIVEEIRDGESFSHLLMQRYRTSVLVGPGNGISELIKDLTHRAILSTLPCVLDADALSVYADDSQVLFKLLASKEQDSVLTPHDREFTRLFDIHAGSRLERARAGARACSAIVLLKGADTVIAAPDGRAAINTNAPPELATAGTGDVLAGIIVGLLAQGVPGFEAACAGSWIHGAAAAKIGIGLIADDLPDVLPAILTSLKARSISH